jgi:hypothetical protein
MDKGIHIHVRLLIFHGLGIVLGCTMMSLYILLGLFQSHIYVIGLHGRISLITAYRLKICRGHVTMSSALRFILFSIAIYIEFISAMISILYK